MHFQDRMKHVIKFLMSSTFLLNLVMGQMGESSNCLCHADFAWFILLHIITLEKFLYNHSSLFQELFLFNHFTQLCPCDQILCQTSQDSCPWFIFSKRQGIYKISVSSGWKKKMHEIEIMKSEALWTKKKWDLNTRWICIL